MGLLERLRHAIRTDVQDLYRTADDPERCLSMLVVELESVRDDALRGVSETTRLSRRLRREALEWQHRGHLLEDAGRTATEQPESESLGAAAGRRAQAGHNAHRLAVQIDLHVRGLEMLQCHLSAVEARLIEARHYRDLAAAHLRLPPSESPDGLPGRSEKDAQVGIGP